MAQHKPPSRVRYEKTHPVIAFRVKQDLYDALAEHRRDTGSSYAEIMRKGMEADRRVKETWEEAWWRGAKMGKRMVPPQLFLRKIPVQMGECKHCGAPITWNALDVEDHRRTWGKLNQICPDCHGRPGRRGSPKSRL